MMTARMRTLAALLAVAWGGLAIADPFTVSPVAKETNWDDWGYVVDGQTWGNWFAVDIAWGTDAAMSGTYVIQEDLLFWVDPATSGLSDPTTTYGQNFWNHDDVYGLGEFFDAGLGVNDRHYAFTLLLGDTDTWQVWYDDDQDLENDGGWEHAILEGTVDSYWNDDGHFYGILSDDDGSYDGDFLPSHDEGTPNLVVNGFHAGHAEPVPLPGAVLLGVLGLGAAGVKLRKSV